MAGFSRGFATHTKHMTIQKVVSLFFAGVAEIATANTRLGLPLRTMQIRSNYTEKNRVSQKKHTF